MILQIEFLKFYAIFISLLFQLGFIQAKNSVASGHVSYKDLSLNNDKNLIFPSLHDSSGKSEYVIVLNKEKVFEGGKVFTHDDSLLDEFTLLGWKKKIEVHPLLKSRDSISKVIQLKE